MEDFILLFKIPIGMEAWDKISSKSLHNLGRRPRKGSPSRWGWPHTRSGRLGEEKNLLP